MDINEYLRSRSEIINIGKRIALGSDNKVAKPHLRHYPSALYYIPQGIDDEIDSSSMCDRKCIFSMLGFPVAQASKISIEHFYRGHIIAAGEAEALNAALKEENKDRLESIPILAQLISDGWRVFDDISNPAIMAFQSRMEDCMFVDSGRFDMILSPDDNPLNANAIVEELKAPNDANFTKKKSLSSLYYLQSSSYAYHHSSQKCGLCARSGSSEHYQYWATHREGDIFISNLIAGNGASSEHPIQCVSLKGMVDARKHVEKMVVMFLTEDKYTKMSSMPQPKTKGSNDYPCAWGKDKYTKQCSSFCEYYDYCWTGYPLDEWKSCNEKEAREQLFMIQKKDVNDVN